MTTDDGSILSPEVMTKWRDGYKVEGWTQRTGVLFVYDSHEALRARLTAAEEAWREAEVDATRHADARLRAERERDETLGRYVEAEHAWARQFAAAEERAEQAERERDEAEDARHRIVMATAEGENDEPAPWDMLATGVESLRESWIAEFQRAEDAEARVATLEAALRFQLWLAELLGQDKNVARIRAALGDQEAPTEPLDWEKHAQVALEAMADAAPQVALEPERCHTVTVAFEDGWTTVRMTCPFDVADESRPCWPRDDHGEPEPAPQDFCNWKEWFDSSGGAESMREHTLGTWPVESEWDGEAMWFSVRPAPLVEGEQG